MLNLKDKIKQGLIANMKKGDIITQFKIPKRFYDMHVNAVKQEIAKE
jgi:hypothetical protein